MNCAGVGLRVLEDASRFNVKVAAKLTRGGVSAICKRPLSQKVVGADAPRRVSHRIPHLIAFEPVCD